ncbi:MAG TPA: hypothetical protein VFO01_04930 [Trebonia sp.]|nr:hypothetical protein [Trebonia sp.]
MRIVGSVAVGLAAGPPSLVLFHNIAGSMFGFAYTLGGFIIVIAVLLPRGGTPLDGPEAGWRRQKGPAGAPVAP